VGPAECSLSGRLGVVAHYFSEMVEWIQIGYWSDASGLGGGGAVLESEWGQIPWEE
jgi:hypothetical protein